MAIASSRVTVTTTATAIVAPDEQVTAVRFKVPTGGQAVFVGGSSVTTATGYEVAAGESVSLTLSPADSIYGIVAATTQAVHLLRD